MKSNNNIFKYIFIIFIIGLIIGAVYILYYSKNKKNTESAESENNIQSTSENISVVENMKMGISNYDTMNPLLTKNKEIVNLDKLIFEPLINITSNFHTEMCLAKSCTKKTDTSYEIKVDTSNKWQDGTSVISKDVQFTIYKLKEINSIYSDNVKFIQSVDATDSEIAIINLSQEVPFFEYNLTFPLLSSSYYMNEDFINSNKIPIGTGVYKIASINDDNVFLIRNDRWRDIKSNTPKTQSITIHKYVSIGEMFNSFKLGNIDIINTMMPNYSDYVGTMGYNKKEYTGREYEYLSFNCNDIILSDASVRKAINYAINKQNIVSTIFNNSKIVANSPLDYGNYLYNDKNIIKYNSETAKKTLEDGGWVFASNKWQKNINGYVKKLNLSLVVSKDNEERVNVANEIKDQLSDIGININIVKVSNEKYYEYLNSKDYQIILTGITNSINPDLSYFYGSGNIANYNNENIISKIKSLDNFEEIQKTVDEEVPYIGLYRNKGTLILNANVGGEFIPNNFCMYYNFYKWFRQQ